MKQWENNMKQIHRNDRKTGKNNMKQIKKTI